MKVVNRFLEKRGFGPNRAAKRVRLRLLYLDAIDTDKKNLLKQLEQHFAEQNIKVVRDPYTLRSKIEKDCRRILKYAMRFVLIIHIVFVSMLNLCCLGPILPAIDSWPWTELSI